jgi:hypothetical protein
VDFSTGLFYFMTAITYPSVMTTPALTDSPSHAPPRAAKPLRYPSAFPLLITVLFSVVCGLFIFRHVLWIDEAQAFLLARDSRSVGELFWNLRYEGHPPLWHLLLYALTRFTTSIAAMQTLHLLMAATTVYLVARYSPFPLLAKLLFPFGYFPLFEYGIISRNYQLVLLLSIAFCTLWGHRRTAYLGQGCILALLCLSHVLGVIIAGGFGLILLLDALLTREGRTGIAHHPWRFTAGLVLAIAGATIAIKLLIPPPDYGYATGWRFDWDIPQAMRVLATLRDGLLPIPPMRIHFWGARAGTPEFNAWLGFWLGTGGLLLVLTSWRASLFYLIAVGGQLAFSYIKFMGGVRHHGGIFVVLIAACWIAWQCPTTQRISTWRRWWERTARIALCLLLAAHVYAAAIACYTAWHVPFTVDRAAADRLAQNLRPGDILVADSEFVVPSLAAYLPGQRFYVPTVGEWRTFITWREREAWDTSPLDAAEDIAREHHADVLWITRNREGARSRNLTELGVFDGRNEHAATAVIDSMEQFAIYRIHTPTPQSQP